ncbi:MAG: hypothetical protein ACRD4C_15615 [Candidatus Acidiferrales bacterium]
MGEPTQISFRHSELAEILVKKQGIHEGVWGIYVKFGLQATNAGPTETELTPAALVGVMEIGIQKFDKESNLTVDAAKINPKQ